MISSNFFDVMLLVGVGIVIGLGGAIVTVRSLASFLRGVSPTDLPTFAVTVAILSAVALLGCAIPARRAIRVTPIAALRHE